MRALAALSILPAISFFSRVSLSLSLSLSQAHDSHSNDSLPPFIERTALPRKARPLSSPPGKNAQQNPCCAPLPLRNSLSLVSLYLSIFPSREQQAHYFLKPKKLAAAERNPPSGLGFGTDEEAEAGRGAREGEGVEEEAAGGRSAAARPGAAPAGAIFLLPEGSEAAAAAAAAVTTTGAAAVTATGAVAAAEEVAAGCCFFLPPSLTLSFSTAGASALPSPPALPPPPPPPPPALGFFPRLPLRSRSLMGPRSGLGGGSSPWALAKATATR